jgi:hypothetical protein
MSDEDTELPYPDAKVAEKLCVGGPCFYLFPEELTNNNSELEGGTSNDCNAADFHSQ